MLAEQQRRVPSRLVLSLAATVSGTFDHRERYWRQGNCMPGSLGAPKRETVSALRWFAALGADNDDEHFPPDLGNRPIPRPQPLSLLPVSPRRWGAHIKSAQLTTACQSTGIAQCYRAFEKQLTAALSGTFGWSISRMRTSLRCTRGTCCPFRHSAGGNSNQIYRCPKSLQKGNTHGKGARNSCGSDDI